MEYQQKQSRTQLALYTTCLDDMIAEENSVRTIDRFVDGLDLHSLGFGSMASQGRPPYDPADLLKLYIYGYLNRIRSSRQLELECSRNIELMWLLGNLRPDHNTIARFRKDNPKAIKRVFRATVSIAKNHELIGAVLIAGDSTKLRAQNSKKNNFNLKKVARHLEYIDKKLGEHQRELAKADGDGKEEIRQLAKNRELQRERYVRIQKELRADTSTENPQISTSDPDSRHQIVRGTITEVCYTAQTTVDAEHKLLIDYKITNQNDKRPWAVCSEGQRPFWGPTPLTHYMTRGTILGASSRWPATLGSTPWWPCPVSVVPAKHRTRHTTPNISTTTRNGTAIAAHRATGLPATGTGTGHATTGSSNTGQRHADIARSEAYAHRQSKTARSCNAVSSPDSSNATPAG